jgi:LytS/YehU family sensor histidine kinase
LSALIITPLQMVILYFKYAGFPEVQAQIVHNQFTFFIFAFLVISASTVSKIIVDWARQLKEQQALETQTMQSELRFLKSQINPHFLFNTLNNLYALTLKKSDQAPEIVIKLSEMMRYMLYECNEKAVLLSKEINYIKNFIDLESIRQGKNVEINLEVKGEISEQMIAPLIFIPFLENAFKHGLNNHITQGFVNIFLELKGNTIYFFIENSKPENVPQQRPNAPRSGGIGLVNIHRRLKLIYPDQYDLKIRNTPKTYSVELTLQL